MPGEATLIGRLTSGGGTIWIVFAPDRWSRGEDYAERSRG